MGEGSVKVVLPEDAWRKMEANHELVEEFKLNAEIIGYEAAEKRILMKLNSLLNEKTP